MNSSLLNVIIKQPKWAKRFFLGAVIVGTLGFKASEYHDEVIQYQKDFLESIQATPEDYAEMQAFKDSVDAVEMGKTHKVHHDPDLKLTQKIQDNKKDIAMAEETRSSFDVAYASIMNSVFKNSHDMGVDENNYKNSEAQLDSVRAHFPIFDEYAKKYDDEYVKDVTLYTELPDKSLGVSCTKDFVEKVVYLCQQSDRQRALGHPEKAQQLRKEALFETIYQLEGMRDTAYDDGRGNITIAGGNNMDASGMKEIIMDAIDIDEKEYNALYAGKRKLSHDEMKKITVATIDDDSEYDKIFVAIIKKANNLSSTKKAKELIKNVIPTSAFVAIKAGIHQTPATFDNKELFHSYKVISDKKASEAQKEKAILKICDAYHDKITSKTDIVGVRMQLRSTASEAIMTENTHMRIRKDTELKFIKQRGVAFGNATGNINNPCVGPMRNFSEKELKNVIPEHKTILFARGDGSYLKFDHDGGIEYGQANAPLPPTKTANSKKATFTPSG